jgi:hypothetical protein
MASLKYDEIYSSLYLKAKTYDLLELTNNNIAEFLCGWLHAALSKPHVHRLFSMLTTDDEIQYVKYELKYSIDPDYDKDFILDILGIGMLIEWIQPKIYSLTNIVQVYGSKEEKFYSQSGHLKTLQDIKKQLVRDQRSMIRDRGYIWNTYLDGNNS